MKRERFVPSREYLTFLSRLRLARQEKNVSQRELARRLKWHHSRVVRSEEAQRELDFLETRAICEALQISVVEFTRELEAVLSASDAPNKKDESTSLVEDANVSFDVTATTGTE